MQDSISTSSLLTDSASDHDASRWLARRGAAGSPNAWQRLCTLIGIGERWGSDARLRTSAELTTLQTHSRGQALRDAHRALRRHLDARPVLRRMAPHLSVLERGLARRGSRALAELPLEVLDRAAKQLELLHTERGRERDAQDLRVLQDRLRQALARPGTHQRREGPGPSAPTARRRTRDLGVDVRDISVDEFNAAVRANRHPRGSRH